MPTKPKKPKRGRPHGSTIANPRRTLAVRVLDDTRLRVAKASQALGKSQGEIIDSLAATLPSP